MTIIDNNGADHEEIAAYNGADDDDACNNDYDDADNRIILL